MQRLASKVEAAGGGEPPSHVKYESDSELATERLIYSESESAVRAAARALLPGGRHTLMMQ
jgi:hypothetical protein